MSSTKGGSGRYASKLTFEERCGFYYAFLLGTPKPIIVEASGLNRGTVTRLCDRKYKAYVEVHLKFDELGLQEFRNKYWTIEIMDRVAMALAQAGEPNKLGAALPPHPAPTQEAAAPPVHAPRAQAPAAATLAAPASASYARAPTPEPISAHLAKMVEELEYRRIIKCDGCDNMFLEKSGKRFCSNMCRHRFVRTKRKEAQQEMQDEIIELKKQVKALQDKVNQ